MQPVSEDRHEIEASADFFLRHRPRPCIYELVLKHVVEQEEVLALLQAKLRARLSLKQVVRQC